MGKFAKFALPLLVSCLLSLLFVETGLRIWHGVSPFALTNFRADHQIVHHFKGLIGYDSDLGWSMKPHFTEDGITTVDFGLRRSREDQSEAHRGGILASGSSFTAGVDVGDAETWPAQLERLSGIPVNNGGAPGYGFDQVVLRAEQLMDAVDPDIVVVDIMATTIDWTGYAILNRPKPYFLVENHELVRRHEPVPKLPYSARRDHPLKRIAGYSLAIDRTMAAIDAPWWYARGERTSLRSGGDPVELSCLLIRRIAKKTSERDIRLLVVSIPTGQDLLAADEPATTIAKVEQCARDYRVQIAPVRARLTAAISAGEIGLDDIYQVADGKPAGHLTEAGNRFVAEIVHEALREPYGTAPVVD